MSLYYSILNDIIYIIPYYIVLYIMSYYIGLYWIVYRFAMYYIYLQHRCMIFVHHLQLFQASWTIPKANMPRPQKITRLLRLDANVNVFF